MDESIEQRLNTIEAKLDDIIAIIGDNIEPNCTRMGRHITFVECVYDHIRHPLSFIVRQLKSISDSDNDTLPRIEN